MAIRSWLFVPGDSERKLSKVAASGADAVIIDLEDSVPEANKAEARTHARQWLSAHGEQVLAGGSCARWVRINALGSHHWREDLAQIMPAAPNGIVVSKAEGEEPLQMLAAEIYEMEQRNGLPTGSTKIMPMLAETPTSALTITSYATITQPRLGALTWGAEDLATSMGTKRKRDDNGRWTDLFAMVRSQLLLAARARNLPAIDTIYGNFSDLDGLKTHALAAYADGFSGMLAIHPSQVPVINEAFAPSAGEIANANAIIDAFAEHPGEVAIQIDGVMVEKLHLEAAYAIVSKSE